MTSPVKSPCGAGERLFSIFPRLQDLAWRAKEASKMCELQVIILVVDLCSDYESLALQLLQSENIEPGKSLEDLFPSGLAIGLAGVEIVKLAKALQKNGSQPICTEPEKGAIKCIFFHQSGITSTDIMPERQKYAH